MKKRFIVLSILVTAVSCLLNNFVFAEEEEDVFHLEKIVITPSRLYQEYGQVSRATNLITKGEIEDNNPLRAGDLLGDLPSAFLIEYGSLGSQSSIRLRGATSRQTLVLIDGMPVNNLRNGKVDFSDYSVENIESIEVVRGPSSSLYGSSAVGGTINIITKKGESETPKTTLTSRYGAWQTHIHELTHGAKIRWFDYFLSASSANSQGARDNSDYKAETVNAKVGFDIGQHHHFSLSGRLYQSELGTPGSVTSFDKDDRQENKQNYLNGIWESNFHDRLQLKLQGYMNLDRLEFTETVFPALDKDTHQSKERALNFQGSYEIVNNTNLMFGIEGKEFRLNSETTGKHGSTSRSIYAHADFRYFDFLDLIGGARVDDYSNFGTEASPSANVALKFGPWKIRGLFAESYSVPTFNDLFWPETSSAKGNPNLRPERGTTYEGGIENIFDLYIFNKFALDIKTCATFFHTEMKDLIDWAKDPDDSKWTPTNVEEAKIQGIELESEMRLFKNTKATFNYTLTKAKNIKTEQILTNQPKHKFDFSVSYKHPWGIIGRFSGQYVSQTFEDEANNNSNKPYWAFGADLYYDIDKHTRYFINIDNIFNRTYEKKKGYPMPGFSITTGVRTKF